MVWLRCAERYAPCQDVVTSAPGPASLRALQVDPSAALPASPLSHPRPTSKHRVSYFMSDRYTPAIPPAGRLFTGVIKKRADLRRVFCVGRQSSALEHEACDRHRVFIFGRIVQEVACEVLYKDLVRLRQCGADLLRDVVAAHRDARYASKKQRT